MKKMLLAGLAISLFILAQVSADLPKTPSPSDAAAKKAKAEWISELVKKLKSSDLWVRVEAIKKLGDTEAPQAVPSLRQALNDESIDVNVEALRALKKIGDEDSLKLLLRGSILYDLHSLRFYALDGAASIDPARTRKHLLNNLKSQYPEIRANAAEALGNFFTISNQRDKSMVQDLINTLSENNGAKQSKVINALNIITGANINSDNKEQWQGWLNDNKKNVDTPPKKVVSRPGPLPPAEKAKVTEQKEAEKKFDEFRDTAVLSKQSADSTASYYLARTDKGKKLALAAFGHRDNRVTKMVDEALNWLHRHQEKEGYWDYNGYIRNCPHGQPDNIMEIKGDYDVAVTGLALLAFLAAGHTHIPGQKAVETSAAPQTDLPPGGQYKPTVERGLRWLLSIQMGDGSFRNPVTGAVGNKVNMFEQAMATLAISEAYGMTGDETLKGPAQKALDFISYAKNPGKGWRYHPRCGDNDTSLVGWQVFALKSGKVSGLEVKRQDFEDASGWIDDVTAETGRVGYNEKGKGSPTITSIGIICRMLLGWRSDSPLMQKGATIVLKDDSYQKSPVNFYHIYQTALAMFQMGGKFWEVWNKDMTDFLAKTVSKDGCEKGSWPAADEKYCHSRVYTTALGALSLEVYWRYLPFAR